MSESPTERTSEEPGAAPAQGALFDVLVGGDRRPRAAYAAIREIEAMAGQSVVTELRAEIRSAVQELRTEMGTAVQELRTDITLVMDNLSTHRPGALYEAFPPAEAKDLWDRFEFVYTPEHGSWLNVAGVELNVLTRQCLNRRLDSIDLLRDEVAAWQASRDRIQAKVNWRFTTPDARVKLKRLYPTLDE